MATLGLLYALAMVQQVAFVALAAGLTETLGGRVVELAVGSPRLFALRRRGIAMSFGPIPASSVSALGRATFEDGPRTWSVLPLARRLVIVLGPWAALAILAAACLGPAHAARSIAHGFSQVALVLDPTPLMRSFFALARTAPLHVTFGVLLAKMVAFNLLPLATLAGGEAIDELVSTVRRRRFPTWWTILSLVVALWLVLRFAWAIAHVI